MSRLPDAVDSTFHKQAIKHGETFSLSKVVREPCNHSSLQKITIIESTPLAAKQIRHDLGEHSKLACQTTV